MKRIYEKPIADVLDFELMDNIMDNADLDNPGDLDGTSQGGEWD